MVNINICHSLLCLFLASLQFISLANAAGGVKFDFSRVNIPAEEEIVPINNEALHKRAGSYQEYYLKNEKSWYMINFTLGTPAQEVIGVVIDTGSSDLWVSSPKNKLCEKIGCYSYGTYDPDLSSTWKYNNSKFAIYYGDNTYAKGDFGMDTMQIGDVSIPNLNFAVALDSDSPVGVFGIGFNTLEVAPNSYINFPGALVANGLINSQAYSIFLNDKNAESGTILFGAVDHSKYEGPLITVPIVSNTRTAVRLTGLSIEDRGCEINTFPAYSWYSSTFGQHNKDGLFALLDTGSTLTMLPKNFVAAIGKAFDAYYEDGNYFYSCNAEERRVKFKFGCQTISVPLSNFLDEAYYEDNTPVYFPNGDRMCFMDFIETDDMPILGDSFLRSAYVVMDLDNKEASLAQAKLDPSTSSDIEEIQIGPDGVPGVTKVPAACRADVYESCQPSSISTSSTSSVLTSSSNSPSNSGISSVSSSGSSIVGVISSASDEKIQSTSAVATSSHLTSSSVVTSYSVTDSAEEVHSSMTVVASSTPSTTTCSTLFLSSNAHFGISSGLTSDFTSATSSVKLLPSVLVASSSSMTTSDFMSSYSTPTSLVSQSQSSTTAIPISSISLAEDTTTTEIIDTTLYTTEIVTSCETTVNSHTTEVITVTYTTVFPCSTTVASVLTFEPTPATVIIDATLYTTETATSCVTIVNSDTTEVITITYTTVVPCLTTVATKHDAPSQLLGTDPTFEVTTAIVHLTPTVIIDASIFTTETITSCETIENSDTTEVITLTYTVTHTTKVATEPEHDAPSQLLVTDTTFETTTPTVIVDTLIYTTETPETIINSDTTELITLTYTVTDSIMVSTEPYYDAPSQMLVSDPTFGAATTTVEFSPAVITNPPYLSVIVNSNTSITPIEQISPNFASLITPYIPTFICVAILSSIFLF